MYDKMSPTLKTISNNTKAFDKNLQDLEKQCKAYVNRQSSLVREMAELKKSLVENKQRVTEVTDAWKKNKDALTENNLKSAIQERELLNQKIKDTERPPARAKRDHRLRRGAAQDRKHRCWSHRRTRQRVSDHWDW